MRAMNYIKMLRLVHFLSNHDCNNIFIFAEVSLLMTKNYGKYSDSSYIKDKFLHHASQKIFKYIDAVCNYTRMYLYYTEILSSNYCTPINTEIT